MSGTLMRWSGGLLALWLMWGLASAGHAQDQDLDSAIQTTREHLEPLRTSDPVAYQKVMTQMERQAAIARIVQQVHVHQLDADVAAKQLYPLVKAQIQDEVASADQQIAGLKQYLHMLEEMKRNPEAATRKRIDTMVGKDAEQLPTTP